MTQLWHCTPTQFEDQPEHMVELHREIFNEVNRKEKRDKLRNDQLEKLNNQK